MRRFFSELFARALRIFFRRVELEGAERVPREGGVIFAVNHPNALVDPLLLLCFAPRPVSFLAKAPLFGVPVLGFFVRAFDSIPVHRPEDSASKVFQNRQTFEAARGLLSRGGALALFPEGASHDDPKLRSLRTGAARIALGAAAHMGSPLALVPTGLYYTWKERFRSSVLLSFGDPIPVTPVPPGSEGEPPPDAVRELTGRLEQAMFQCTLQAESHEALDLARRAERIFSAGEGGPHASLGDELERRRRFLEGQRRLLAQDPRRLAFLEDRIARFEAERKAAGLSLEHLTSDRLGPQALARLLGHNLGALLLFPFASVGFLLHLPAYQLVGFVSRRFARSGEDAIATVKVSAAMLLFPATWLAAVVVAWKAGGSLAGFLTLVLAPLCGWAALVASESLDAIGGRARALLHLISSRYAMKRLLAERRAIREEILRIGEELEIVSHLEARGRTRHED